MSLADPCLKKATSLWVIARRILAPERTYTEDHVKTKLEIYLKISSDRAVDEFKLMVNQGIISPTFGEKAKYYLSDTTPF